MKKYVFLLLFIPSIALSQLVNWDNFFIGHSWLKKTSGVIYFEKDLINNSSKMCNDIKEEPWRLTMIDQESKEISRIKEAAFPAYKNLIELKKFKNEILKNTKKLKKYCLRVNLAPVVDMGSRGYGTDINQILTYSNSFANILRDNNIVPTWKHFPGMSQNQVSVYNSKYKSYYKNIYAEGIIDNKNLIEVEKYAKVFKNQHSDILMFSIATYKNILDKPIIFSEDIWKLAYMNQPNSLYIPDDLSELNLSDKDILWLFNHFDLLLYTNPNDILVTKNILEKLYKSGQITYSTIKYKIDRQNNWRKINSLPNI